jgi:hypothetical protein
MFNIIPLGDHCAIGSILQELKMRDKSFPFDWTAHYDSLNNSSIYTNIEIINKLENIENIDEIIDYYLGNAFENNLINSKTQLWFPHDAVNKSFTKNDVIQRYKRRFNRLLNSLNNNKNIFIITTRIFYIEEANFKILYNKIMNYNKDNIIIIISGTEHDYFNTNLYTNVIYKYIYYDKRLYYGYDTTHFRPAMKNFIDITLKKLLSL